MTEERETRRARDRAATERALVQAAGEVLADEGFQGLGINAVARRAGCDKQLIYRYFGGIEGLVDAIGLKIADDLRTRLQGIDAANPPATYRELVERMMMGFLHTLQEDPLMRKIMVWEIAEPSDLVRRLTLARSKSMMAWVIQAHGMLQPPAGVDVPATNAVLLAAIQHLVLSGASAGQFSGVSLVSDADWDRIRAVMLRLIHIAYPEP